jgi:flagellar motility protein MotE (MotC chaperone)
MAKPKKDAEDLNITNGHDKKEDAKREKRPPKARRGLPAWFVPILVLVIIIGGIAAVLFFNVYDIREKWIMPYLRNAPLIGATVSRWPPPPEEGDEAEPEPVGKYSKMTEEELESLITSLEAEAEKAKDDLKTAQDKQKADADTINNLTQYKDQIEGFRAQKDAFDEMVANGNPAGYSEFYESVSPENAERIYREISVNNQYNSEVKRVASTLSGMDEENAAEALTNLLATDADLVISVLTVMDQESRSAILNEMTPENVARITRLMYPENPQPAAAVETAQVP